MKPTTDPSFSLERTPIQTDSQQEESRRKSLAADVIPRTVGGYDVLKCLGEGSFGTVWLARERKTGRQVAIKFFTHRRGIDWTLLTREVEKLAVLDASRDVVRLLDVGIDHDPPYFVMEYLPHRSVATLLEVGPLSIEKSVEITRSIARALVHAHGAGILHCDIKPGNVLLDHGDEARLSDFGQSRLCSDQSPSLGTFFYMAPEQAAKNAIPDVRWDIYALGALLYHMLTGAPPFRGEEADEEFRSARNLDERLERYRRKVIESPPPSDHRLVPKIDGELVRIVDRCLSRDPNQRFASAQQILDELDRRDMKRATMPLMWLAFLTPLVFFVALLLIGSSAVPETVNRAEQLLFDRALAGDMATARLLAVSLQQELSDRQDELERLARSLPVPERNGGYFGFREDLFTLIEDWKHECDTRMERQGRAIDESLFLTDKRGIQIFRSPWSESIGNTFAFRDYFHGLGRELSPNRDDVSLIMPRTKPGVSMAFRSSNTGQFMVAIAVPVWNAEGSEVIGVLARTLHLGDLLKRWEQRIYQAGGSGESRFLSLVDLRVSPPMLLDHHWLTDPENLKSIRDEAQLKELLQLRPDEEALLRTAARKGQGLSDYRDPLASHVTAYQEPWLAAVAPVSGIDWMAIVQERRAEAVQPMADVQWMFLRYFLLVILVVVMLLGVLWWSLKRVMAV